MYPISKIVIFCGLIMSLSKVCHLLVVHSFSTPLLLFLSQILSVVRPTIMMSGLVFSGSCDAVISSESFILFLSSPS